MPTTTTCVSVWLDTWREGVLSKGPLAQAKVLAVGCHQLRSVLRKYCCHPYSRC